VSSPLVAAQGAGSAVGRYFSTVSVIPAALLVMYVWLLVAAGALSGEVDPAAALHAIRSLQLPDLVWFTAVSLLLALATHPLQFPVTQLLEGYWGAGRLGMWLTHRGVARHRARAMWAESLATACHRDFALLGSALFRREDAPASWDDLDPGDQESREADARNLLETEDGSRVLHLHLRKEAAQKIRDTYPEELERCMPTRLGNVLRRSEDRAGKQYEINTIVVAPHLSLVADPAHYKYVRDRQKVMDLSISLCAIAALGCVLTALLLVDDGPWALVAFAPLAVAYVAYLGAVASARSYCVAIETVNDLSRFRLYEALHLPLPDTLADERTLAASMIAMLTGEQVDGPLCHPAPTPTPGATT